MSMPYIIESSEKGDKTYEIYSRLLKDRIVYLQGEFNDTMANGVVAQLLYLQSDNAEKDIYMYINSNGGHIASMYCIYDLMNYISCDIHTVGLGTCASAASFILAAGTPTKRSILPNAQVMIHEISAGAQGRAQDMFLEIDKLKRMYEKMAKQYSEFTGKTIKKIKADMARDTWMNAEEALEYGLVDKIIGK